MVVAVPDLEAEIAITTIVLFDVLMQPTMNTLCGRREIWKFGNEIKLNGKMLSKSAWLLVIVSARERP